MHLPFPLQTGVGESVNCLQFGDIKNSDVMNILLNVFLYTRAHISVGHAPGLELSQATRRLNYGRKLRVAFQTWSVDFHFRGRTQRYAQLHIRCNGTTGIVGLYFSSAGAHQYYIAGVPVCTSLITKIEYFLVFMATWITSFTSKCSS